MTWRAVTILCKRPSKYCFYHSFLKIKKYIPSHTPGHLLYSIYRTPNLYSSTISSNISVTAASAAWCQHVNHKAERMKQMKTNHRNFAFPNSCHYKFPATAPVTLAVKHNEEGNMCCGLAWHYCNNLYYSPPFPRKNIRTDLAFLAQSGVLLSPVGSFSCRDHWILPLIPLLLLEPQQHKEKKAYIS